MHVDKRICDSLNHKFETPPEMLISRLSFTHIRELLTLDDPLEHLTEEYVSYKKYFYALRPLLAANHIEKHHVIPPVLFEELLEAELPGELKLAIDELLEKKKSTKESDLKPQIPVIQKFISAEIIRQKEIVSQTPDDHNHNRVRLDECFQHLLKRA